MAITEPEFDPSEHTVAEVVEYVDAHPEERDRILSAEIEGQNRSTLVSQLEKANGEEAASDEEEPVQELPGEEAEEPEAEEQETYRVGDEELPLLGQRSGPQYADESG